MKRRRLILTLLGLLGAASLVGAFLAGDWWDEIIRRGRLAELRRRLPRSGFEPLGANDQGYFEYRHTATDLVFVLLPGGTFVMGSPETELGRGSDERQHKVRVSPFLIAKHEVTVSTWKHTMGRDPSFYKRPERPVDSVSWNDIQGFEERTGLGLPTEAQWEYACRAGTATAFAFGASISTDDVKYNGGVPLGARLGPIGSFAPNAFGLHDLHGSIFEWCEDIYDERRHASPRAADGDVATTTGSSDRVIRGGSFISFARHCRSAARDASSPNFRDRAVGFRPAWPPR